VVAPDDESTTSQKHSSRARSQVSIVITITCLGILACCAGGALYFFGNIALNEVPAAEAAANEFFDLLQSGQVDEAYQRTAIKFRDVTTVDQFRGLIAAYQSTTTHNSRKIRFLEIRQYFTTAYVIYRVTLEGPDGEHGCKLSMQKEGDEWKVIGLTLDASMLRTTPKDAAESRKIPYQAVP
jgi:hypothetical protein